MITAILIVAFVFCVAIAAGNILVSRELNSAYDSAFLRYHLYYLVAFYAFALYGLWGKIAARALLPAANLNEAAEAAASLITLLGLPFLFVSSLMLLSMAYATAGRAVTSREMLTHTASLLALIVGSWIVFRIVAPFAMPASLPWYIEAGAAVGLEGVYLAAFIAIVSRQKVQSNGRASIKPFATLFAAAFLSRAIVLPLGFRYPSAMPFAALVYFGSNSVPLFYLRWKADSMFEPIKAESSAAGKLDRVVERYGITKRERQIIEQVCQGKTNQQIADTLFITLQTVKDHTHRIYSKMGISSRMQLVQKLNG